MVYETGLPQKTMWIGTLSGDSSDNIPGMNGIGPVEAKKIIEEYGELDNIPDEYL